MEEIYNQIANRLSETYVVNWETTGSSGDTVYLRITVTYTGASETWDAIYETGYTI